MSYMLQPQFMKTEQEIKDELEEISRNKATIEKLLQESESELTYDIRIRVRDEMQTKIDTLRWVFNR